MKKRRYLLVDTNNVRRTVELSTYFDVNARGSLENGRLNRKM